MLYICLGKSLECGSFCTHHFFDFLLIVRDKVLAHELCWFCCLRREQDAADFPQIAYYYYYYYYYTPLRSPGSLSTLPLQTK
jgi:hypothetical protein